MKKIFLFALIPVAALALAGCSVPEPSNESSQKQAQESLETTQKKLQEAVGVPEITNSTTRQAIADRAKVFDAQNKTTYIYLVSFGKVMAFYPVRGQVVSLRSYLTPVDRIVNSEGKQCDGWACSSSAGALGYVIAAPDIDGTYGDNVDGIFFFTADTGAYVEWKGEYLVSDQPLKFATQPELIREIK